MSAMPIRKNSSPFKKMRPIMAMIRRDVTQIHRHGLLLIAVLSIFLLLFGVIVFSMAKDQFRKTGVPTWTGSILSEGMGEGEPLRAEISADNLTGKAPLTVSFTSTVTGGKPSYMYSWNTGNGTESNASNPQVIYAVPGTYTCYLTCGDSTGENVTASPLMIIVYGEAPGQLQVAISVNQTEIYAPYTVSFYSAVAGGKTPYNYSWDFGDECISSDSNTSHRYETAGKYTARLMIRDSGGNTSFSNNVTITVNKKGGGEGIPLTLLDGVYGYAVLVTMILIPTAFATSYNHEMKRGTVTTLVCYPIGVFGITIAKLLYAALVGFIFSVPVTFLPVLGIGKPTGEVFLIFLIAYILSMVIVATAAFVANAITFATKRMYLRPTALPFFLSIFSFFFTSKIFRWTSIALLSLMGRGDSAPSIVQRMLPITTLSLYHQGGLLLSMALGGPCFPMYLTFLLPLAILLIGIWVSKKLYPDIYEKE